MNEIKIASKLKQLRLKHAVTQSDFADFLLVSKAAVSKWENGLSYPDVELLPKIASYFNTTIDELIDYQPNLSKEATQQLCNRLSKDFTSKPFLEVQVEYQMLIKKYYASFNTLYQIAVLLVNHRIFAGDEEAQYRVVEEAKNLCKRIIMNCNDFVLIQDATYIQCTCELILDQPEAVFKLIGTSLPINDIPKDFLISRAYQLQGLQDKAKEITQCGMYKHVLALIDATLSYALQCEDDIRIAEQAYLHAQKLIKDYKVINLEPFLVHSSYLVGANIYCIKQNYQEALHLLDLYGNLCDDKYFPYKFRGDTYFTKIDTWLASDSFQANMMYDKKMFLPYMLQSIQQFSSLKVLENEMQYQNLIRRITNNSK